MSAPDRFDAKLDQIRKFKFKPWPKEELTKLFSEWDLEGDFSQIAANLRIAGRFMSMTKGELADAVGKMGALPREGSVPVAGQVLLALEDTAGRLKALAKFAAYAQARFNVAMAVYVTGNDLETKRARRAGGES
jgi:hypothetical protein